MGCLQMNQPQTARTKPHLTVGTLGAAQHGAATLNAAVSALLFEQRPELNRRLMRSSPQLGADDYPVDLHRFEYETERRHYLQIGGWQENTSARITLDLVQMDCAILVVDVNDGPMPATREQVLLARQAGVHLLVALTNCDRAFDDELVELVEMEVRALLDEYQFPGADVPIVRVGAISALRGEEQWIDSIAALVRTVDRYLPTPPRDSGAPFLMPLASVIRQADDVALVSGKVERGTVRPGDSVEILGRLGSSPATVDHIEVFGQPAEAGLAGQEVTLRVSTAAVELAAGMVVAIPGTASVASAFRADVYVLTSQEGGLRETLPSGSRLQVAVRTAEVDCVVRSEDDDGLAPGSISSLSIEVLEAVPLELGLRFVLRSDGRTVGAGRVVEVEAGVSTKSSSEIRSLASDLPNSMASAENRDVDVDVDVDVDRQAIDELLEYGVIATVVDQRDGLSITLPSGGVVWPKFQYDPESGSEIFDAVRRTNEALSAAEDPIGAAAWWLTPNRWLDGSLPADLLGQGRDSEVEFAVDQLTNDSW